ncbi:MAG: lycopene cyclase family protein [Flavobacteriales bacterium]|jgi:lycopene beta-cyclase
MNRYDFIIAGCGAAGLQLALAMSEDSFFRNKRILLLDADSKQANDRTWCWWEKGAGRWDHLITKSWKHADFKSDNFEQTIDLGDYTYKMLRGADFYAHAKEKLVGCKGIEWRTESVLEIREQDGCAQVITREGTYEASSVFNSIVDLKAEAASSSYPWIHQHFVGWFIRTREPMFDDSRFMMMDFRIAQHDNTRFMYVLPTSANEALFEYTLFSGNLLDRSEYEEGIRDYLNQAGIREYEIVEQEAGIIPMTIHPFHRKNTAHVLHIGSAGGWTKASTGYTFYLSGKLTARLCNHLKKGASLSSFHRKTRFAFYDAVMLDVLYRRNDVGAAFFTSVYQHNPIERVFRFLNEESSLVEELQIVRHAYPRKELIRSVGRSVFGLF